MRPKKTRWVQCSPIERLFKPQHSPNSLRRAVVLTLDEFEAVRLLDYEGLSQIKTARHMHVHRSTVSRIISSARRKIAQCLVEINTLKIEGGCCKVVKGE
ncbi:MAG: DUF134 domain-containing protein [Candidatus Omnitrophica bacterium]|nr:DUF134 domain-containing protein [Candidatus Omnitrophota bacterium]